jgi:mannose-6-phosphate isomerase-like protein (cupin superfamily)
MSERKQPYVQHMDVLHEALSLIDVSALVARCDDPWYNQTLCQMNDSVVRLGILQGEYHWHRHPDEDEFFFTLQGTLLIDVENRETVALGPLQGYVLPKGVLHRTRAPEKVVVLMVETAAIDPLGKD